LKVKCPWCGAKGTDVEPYPEDMRGPEWTPTRGEEDYAFEVRGNYMGRPVRKCLNCGNGVRVTFLPPRFNKVPPDEWADLQRRWKIFQADLERDLEDLERHRGGEDLEDKVTAVLDALAPRLDRLATSPSGEPLQYPRWAVLPLLKMELAEELALMDDVVSETDPGLAGKKISEAIAPEVEAVYDRVFAKHGRR
jgi:hypothetical protein